MKLQWICLSALLVVSSVGCCHTQCVSPSMCDPCYRPSSCCLTDWLRSKFSCRTCQNYSWSDGGCCDGGCGAGPYGMSMDAGVTYGGGAPGGSCGCGRPHYAPATSTPATAIPVPQADPIPTPIPGTNEPTPAPPATPASPDTTQFQRPTTNQVQHVSVEEFQRLPGVVVAGPGAAPAATPTLAPPQLSSVPVPVPTRQPVQQAQWVPAR